MNTNKKNIKIIGEDLKKNFDVSIIMPFYNKMREFRKVFPKNHKFIERNGIEVVIVLDTPSERDELLDFISYYPFVNWRVVMNEKPHSWRNPAKPLNVGIRYATKQFVMVCSPESEMLTDVIYKLRKTFEDYCGYVHYAIGRVCFVDEEEVTEDTFDTFHNIPFGSIMVRKEHLLQVRGYDETFSEWGGDDNNLRSRLNMLGVKEMFVYEGLMVHRDVDNAEGKTRRGIPFENTPNDVMRHYFFPEKICANDELWGQDFNNVLFDWKNKSCSKENLEQHLSKHYKTWEYTPFSEKNNYPVLLLVQARNECERIESFLERNSLYFDGIILLDDGSIDETYNLAVSDKMLLKIVKEHNFFNDLENRNILLELASFFNFTLGVFLDVDEDVDERYCDFAYYLTDSSDAYMLPLINLWNSVDLYNAEYPNSIDGITLRYKMFRNRGYSQIYSNCGNLHFHQVPMLANSCIAEKILIRHHGMLTKKQRKEKYVFYRDEDKQKSQASYDHMLRNDVRCFSVNEIDKYMLEKLHKRVISFKR